jgi:hypothetical protein
MSSGEGRLKNVQLKEGDLTPGPAPEDELMSSGAGRFKRVQPKGKPQSLNSPSPEQ